MGVTAGGSLELDRSHAVPPRPRGVAAVARRQPRVERRGVPRALAAVRVPDRGRADANGADAETGETPLHRAAAFGTEGTIELLLAAGARVDARDMTGETPLGWASWHGRPDAVLSMTLGRA